MWRWWLGNSRWKHIVVHFLRRSTWRISHNNAKTGGNIRNGEFALRTLWRFGEASMLLRAIIWFELSESNNPTRTIVQQRVCVRKQETGLLYIYVDMRIMTALRGTWLFPGSKHPRCLRGPWHMNRLPELRLVDEGGRIHITMYSIRVCNLTDLLLWCSHRVSLWPSKGSVNQNEKTKPT